MKAGLVQQNTIFVYFVIFSLKSSPMRPAAENLFLQKETKVTKVFAAGQEQALCFLRYLL
jgi:hypothetical protein